MCSTDEHQISSNQSPPGCEITCCTAPPPTAPRTGFSDGCCEAEETPGNDTKDDCCSGSVSKTNSDLKDALTIAAQNCCDDCEEPGGAGCDQECIEKAAAIECQTACEKGTIKEQAPTCDSGCCGGPTELPQTVATDDCCSDEKDEIQSSENARADQSHARDSASSDGIQSLPQCVHPTSASSSDNKHKHDHGKDGRHAGKACGTHLREAFDKYTSYLESARCICKSVLASRVSTCCDKSASPRSKTPKSDASRSTAKSINRECSKDRANKRLARRGRKYSPSHDTAEPEACSTLSVTDQLQSKNEQKSHGGRGGVYRIDVEKVAAREHVLLNVGGMDCSGCADKMTRSLKSLNGVSNVQVVFVTGVAEFDLDFDKLTVEEVIHKAKRATGLHCSRIISDNQTLDVIMDRNTAKQFPLKKSPGVTDFEVIDKKTYRITYNPTRVGARTLLSTIGGARLAGPVQPGTWKQGRAALIKMFSVTFCAAVLTLPVVILAWGDTSVPYKTRSIVSLALATLVQALAVPEFYAKAMRELFYNHIVEMDMLVVISITAAYGYSVVAFGLTHAGYSLETGEFFETSTLLITLVLFGRLISAFARMKAVAAVSLRSLQVEKALLMEPSGSTVEIDARLLQFGDTISIPPHTQIVTDAEIIQGSSAVDESMITGESIPVSRTVGEPVIAGTINGSGMLTARLTRLPGKNSITDIANLVENAYSSKPRVQNLADRVAGYFIPVVTSVSTIVFVIWIVVGLKIRGENGGGAVGVAITYGIAVLAISCPCALGLAVPMVLVVAGGVAARAGIIIKEADVTERAHKTTDVVFDKTGTLTKGNLEVVLEDVITESFAPSTISAIVKSLVQNNPHPVSLAVASILKERQCDSMELEDVQSTPGAGITATWNASIVKAGNPYWLGIDRLPQIAALIDQGLTLLCVTLDTQVLIAFGLKSTLRDEASSVIAELHRRNIQTHIVSGDAPKVVEEVARAVSIPRENVASRQSPADKQKYVQGLQEQGKVVLFCGDGTNDAVAIAQASVGVQIGSSSDITRATADVILLSGLEGLLALMDVSKAAFRRIVFNFVWSAVYNVAAILFAAGAFVKVRIEPAYAGLGEVVSVVPVIVVALTIPKVKRFVQV